MNTLSAAWLKVRSNKGGAGSDGITVYKFEKNALNHLTRLQIKVRAGRYRPRPLRHMKIPKRSGGGMRQLAIPAVVDRVLQTAAAMVMTPTLDSHMEDDSFAYRPGRSVKMATERISQYYKAGYKWVVEGDIEDYFGCVPHGRLMERLSRYIEDHRILDLIYGWISAAAPDGIGIPQGSPISPLLANIYLDDVDEKIATKGLRLVRFADDFVILCKQEDAAKGGLALVEKLLKQEGLKLNRAKSRIVDFETGFRFLGHLFVRSLVLETGEHRQLLAEGLAVNKPVILDEGSEDAGEFLRVVMGDCKNTNNALGNSTARVLIRTLYIHQKGRFFTVRNQSFSVRDSREQGSKELMAIMPRNIDRIEIGAAVEIDDSALWLAAETGVPVGFVDGYGKEKGCLTPTDSGAQAKLHIVQAAACLDDGVRQGLSRTLVKAKIHNQRALLRRLNRRKKDQLVSDNAKKIGRLTLKTKICHTRETLMGVEGSAAQLYWPALLSLIGEAGWGGKLRTRRPADDPLNFLYNWAAHLLTKELSVIIGRHGLHCGFSVLHAVQDNRQSLALDLMEPYRPALSEGLVLYLINNNIVLLDHFGKNDDGDIYILPEGRDLFIRSFEQWMERQIKSPLTGELISWRHLIDEDVHSFKISLFGKGDYAPYHMDY